MICDEIHRIFLCAETGEPTSAANLRGIIGAWRGRNLAYINRGGQQDAAMFLTLLLELVEEELTNAGQGHRSLRSRYEGTFQYQYWFLDTNGQCLTCGKWQPPTEQPFKVLNVEMPGYNNLQGMINNSFENDEKLMRRCSHPGCPAAIPGVSNERPAMSRKTVTSLPEVVFLQVPKIAERNTYYDHDGYLAIQ